MSHAKRAIERELEALPTIEWDEQEEIIVATIDGEYVGQTSIGVEGEWTWFQAEDVALGQRHLEVILANIVVLNGGN